MALNQHAGIEDRMQMTLQAHASGYRDPQHPDLSVRSSEQRQRRAIPCLMAPGKRLDDDTARGPAMAIHLRQARSAL